MKTTKNTIKKGFSLPEVMVAVAVIAGVVIASTNLLISSTRTNNLNAQRLTAYYLAQEGIELTRNIRDSNWLQGIDWRGRLLDKYPLTETGLENGTFIIDKSNLGKTRPTLNALQNSKISTSNELKNYTPWNIKETKCDLTKIEENQFCNEAKLYLFEAENLGNFYSHNPNLTQAKKIRESGFYRTIQIEDIKDTDGKEGNESPHLRVKSIVGWKDNIGGFKTLELTTELTDWKK